MDPSVRQAMQRWPAVPAVYGWLSLDARGQWRLHDGGTAYHAASNAESNTGRNPNPGEPITHAQIISFINRNYHATDDGAWYFQNGPQRVYVRIDAAPLIIRIADSNDALISHTHTYISHVHEWLLDSHGRLYANTTNGGAMVLDRHLETVLTQLQTADGEGTLLDLLTEFDWSEASFPPPVPTDTSVEGYGLLPAPLRFLPTSNIADALRFVPCPKPFNGGNPS